MKFYYNIVFMHFTLVCSPICHLAF
uniref:Uncharacterized protein n=1 Tax=Rhizophora mucronata TaxID=61149 RepID=A0A2P2NI93_RHIMU